jgi:hypothetical protein
MVEDRNSNYLEILDSNFYFSIYELELIIDQLYNLKILEIPR